MKASSFQVQGKIPLQAPHEDGVRRPEVPQTPMHLQKSLNAQRRNAEYTSPSESWKGKEPGKSVLRKPGSDSKQGRQVRFHEEVELATFERHSPSATELEIFFQNGADFTPDKEIIAPGQESAILQSLLQTVEDTAANAVTLSKRARTQLEGTVALLVGELERYGQSQENPAFAAHCRSLLKSHREDLVAVVTQYDVHGRSIEDSLHDMALLGDVVASMRRIERGMDVGTMKQVLRSAKNVGSGLLIVEKQLKLALDRSKQEPSIAEIEYPYETLGKLWRSWTKTCREGGVRGHFVRQWWMYSSDLRKGSNLPLSDAIDQLCESDQFDAGQVKKGLSHLLDALRDNSSSPQLLEDFCNIGQSGDELEKTLRDLRRRDKLVVHTALNQISRRIAAYELTQAKKLVSMVLVAADDLEKVAISMPLRHTSAKEARKILEPALAKFRDVVFDGMGAAKRDFRRQMATRFFASTTPLEVAVEKGNGDVLLTVLSGMTTSLRSIAVGKPFEEKMINAALNGLLDMFGGDEEMTLLGILWMAMDRTEEFHAALGALMEVLDDDDREPQAVRKLANVMFNLQTQR